MKISGGYVLLSRKIDDSEVMKMPPATREVWMYILRKVNHAEYKNLGRGENIFHYKDIADDLCWFVGYRKIKYSKDDITKSIRRLREGNMIDTMKATHGVIIKVLNYDVYQDPENYEGTTKDTMKAPRRIRGASTIYKNGKNDKNNKNDTDTSGEVEKYLEHWNTLFGTKYKSVTTLKDNYEHWRKIYSQEEILQAITNYHKNKNDHWAKSATPELFLRTMTRSRENCDYLGELLNQFGKKSKLNNWD